MILVGVKCADGLTPVRIVVNSSAMKRTFALLPALVVILLTLTSCQSAYYAAYEKFGVYKRDLLK